MNNIFNNFKQKSPKQRFLFVLGLVMILAYLIIASIFIFWESMPVTVPYSNRLAFGVLLVVYAIFRFYRFNTTFKDE
ncbi:hypothetical protein [Flavobacterium sp.]|jgi:hypothetical protein|uniref:hypothetical protein n=1 Tax=Flavobacterium sp. TaxID=239 RepID=UPI0025BD9F8B|nr:hypothetical protein [Flavobacterium sp.]